MLSSDFLKYYKSSRLWKVARIEFSFEIEIVFARIVNVILTGFSGI